MTGTDILNFLGVEFENKDQRSVVSRIIHYELPKVGKFKLQDITDPDEELINFERDGIINQKDGRLRTEIGR